MSRETRQLLDAVLANPCEDLHRLNYAEHDDDAGDFIRVQLAIARELRAGDEPPIELLDREALLLPEQQAKWAERLAAWGAKDLVFRRGFVERLSLSGRSFIELGKSLFDFLPLHGVRLVAVKWFLDEVAKCEHLSWLKRLDLSGNRIGSEGLNRIISTSKLNQFTHLDLSQNDLCDEDVVWLATDELRELKVGSNRLTSFDCNRFSKLNSLDLSGNELVHFDVSNTIRRLNLSGCGLEQPLLNLGCVTELDLSYNPFAKVTDSCHSNLKSLWLRGNRLTAKDLIGLKLPQARTLDLGANFFGDQIMEWLKQAELKSLHLLDLTNVLLTDRGIAELCDSGILNSLHSLNLSWNGIGDAGAKRLAACPEIQNLRVLDMSGTRIGRAGWRALRESPYLRKLRHVV